LQQSQSSFVASQIFEVPLHSTTADGVGLKLYVGFGSVYLGAFTLTDGGGGEYTLTGGAGALTLTPGALK
jgi:hypothetical protein